MASVENTVFQNEAVAVDGTQFKNCTFSNATLVFAGGDLPSFVDCQFRSVALEFDGAAVNTFKFLTGMQAGGFSQAVSGILAGIRQR